MSVPVLQKEERRTGARMFILSGTVGNDPLIFFKRDVCNIRFENTQQNIDRTFGVAGCIGVRTSHIHDDGFARVKRRLGIFHRNARDSCL